MSYVISAITSIGMGLFWLVQEFFPFIVKKFGLGAIKSSIQTVISSFVIIVTIAFWAAMVTFITTTYTYFKDFLIVISNPMSSSSAAGNGSEYISCFIELLQVSGIASGFNSAVGFTMIMLVFMFSLIVFRTARSSLTLISDEVDKNLKYF